MSRSELSSVDWWHLMGLDVPLVQIHTVNVQGVRTTRAQSEDADLNHFSLPARFYHSVQKREKPVVPVAQSPFVTAANSHLLLTSSLSNEDFSSDSPGSLQWETPPTEIVAEVFTNPEEETYETSLTLAEIPPQEPVRPVRFPDPRSTAKSKQWTEANQQKRSDLKIVHAYRSSEELAAKMKAFLKAERVRPMDSPEQPHPDSRAVEAKQVSKLAHRESSKPRRRRGKRHLDSIGDDYQPHRAFSLTRSSSSSISCSPSDSLHRATSGERGSRKNNINPNAIVAEDVGELGVSPPADAASPTILGSAVEQVSCISSHGEFPTSQLVESVRVMSQSAEHQSRDRTSLKEVTGNPKSRHQMQRLRHKAEGASSTAVTHSTLALNDSFSRSLSSSSHHSSSSFCSSSSSSSGEPIAAFPSSGRNPVSMFRNVNLSLEIPSDPIAPSFNPTSAAVPTSAVSHTSVDEQLALVPTNFQNRQDSHHQSGRHRRNRSERATGDETRATHVRGDSHQLRAANQRSPRSRAVMLSRDETRRLDRINPLIGPAGEPGDDESDYEQHASQQQAYGAADLDHVIFLSQRRHSRSASPRRSSHHTHSRERRRHKHRHRHHRSKSSKRTRDRKNEKTRN